MNLFPGTLTAECPMTAPSLTDQYLSSEADQPVKSLPLKKETSR